MPRLERSETAARGRPLLAHLLLLLRPTVLQASRETASNNLLQRHVSRQRLGNVCHAASEEFNPGECHRLTVGVADPALLLRPDLEVPAPSLVSYQEASSCPQRFYSLSVLEAEEIASGLRQCLVSTWAAKMQRGLAAAPCAASSPADAGVVVLPGYSAVECNWPIYGGGNCRNKRADTMNYARAGVICRTADTLHAFLRIQQAFGKRAVVLENSPNPYGDKYDLPDGSFYSEPAISMALVGTDSAHYRYGTDISVPPGPPLRCNLSSPASKSAASFAENLDEKAYLASFKGSFHYHPIRVEARNALHDGSRFIIADAADYQWDFEDLLYSSVFSLILRGDAIMTTRINEAICSGGIPVLVTDSWVPPFNETVPFETFGLVHDQGDLATLKTRLESVNSQQRSRLREAAHNACKRHFQTIDAHALSLSQAVSQLNRLARGGTGASHI